MKISIFTIVFSAILMVFCAQNSYAQVRTTYALTETSAKKIADAAVKFAKDNKAPGGCIAIVDAAGTLVYLIRMDGTFPAASEVSHQKARTAVLFHKDTKAFEDNINGGRVALTTVGPVMLQGGVQIIYKGEVIGAIGVSGASSADQDREIATAGSVIKLD
jgi:glc operon protein GlcG